ncbi:MAG: SpoIIIAH-like family protein [Clostridia bacterium]|nr:SpoIIIAH-like family protein [Clostridia bacterium]
MNTEKKQNKFKQFFKKIGTKNLIVICAVLLVGAAVCVNYIIYNDSKDEPISDVDIDLNDTDLNETLDKDPNASNYFAQTILSRKQARDEALEVLQSVATSDSALPETVETALNDISQIARDIETESNIETLIEAKGFEQCIAVISEGKATVIVQTDGLLANEVAQINEIVYEASGILPTDLKIIEKN